MRALVASTSYPRNAGDWHGHFIDNMAVALPSEGVEVGGIVSRLRAGPISGLNSAFGLLQRLWRVCRREKTNVMRINWRQNAQLLNGTRHPAVIGVLGSDFGLLRLLGMAALLKSVLAGRRGLLAPNAQWLATTRETQAKIGDGCGAAARARATCHEVKSG